MNSSHKRVLHWLGSLLSVLGVGFVVYRLSVFSAQLNFSQFGTLTWSIMLGATLIYALANSLLAFAWWNLLANLGALTDRLWAVRTYGLTQVAKYIPGNIMHLASRQAMGMAKGLPAWSLARSSLWEIGLILGASFPFFVLLLPDYLTTMSQGFALVGFVLTAWVAIMGLWRMAGPEVARGFGFYVLFLLLSGMVFAGMVASIVGFESMSLELTLTYCAAFVTAWVIGLVTPGAPAGIGVRELVLLVLLKSLLPEAHILLSVLLSRAVTVGGDILFYLACIGLARKGDPNSPRQGPQHRH
jgi:uncharacterized membrane protein YbhN (UPF0104 family)